MSKRLGIVLLTAAAAIALFVGLSSTRSQGAAGPVAVYPTQGTPVASPTSQVSFRGASVSDLGQVTVDGSKTGHHDGTLKAHSDGNGASFVPATPFAPGETVTVRSSAASLVGAVNGAVTFTILTPPAGKPPKPQLLADPGGHPRVPQFHTRRDIQAPGLQVLKRTAAAAPGSIFVGAKAGPGADGPAIYNGTNGQLVWFHRMPRHQSAFDFRVQQYQGGQVLTWWQGRAIFPGEGLGVGMIYDTSYRHIATVRAGNGYKSDLHEFQLTPQGTALLVAYRPVSWDLTPAHGARRAVAVDCVLQEVDVKTGLVEREWHSL
ncbi:MAG: arylsulfotransferase family protein, partial [Thermoleophilaceae bacterium]